MKMIAMVALLSLATGCGGSTGTREPDEYTGCATDEHWRTFDDQEPAATVDDTMAPLFTMPTGAATVAAADLKIEWQQDPNDVGAPDGDVPYVNGPDCNMCCPEFNIGGLQTLHLPPISGDVYDLQFWVGGSVVHRVITTLQEWGPQAADLGKFRNKSVSLKIWRMSLLRNDVKQGPYVGTHPLVFSVGG